MRSFIRACSSLLRQEFSAGFRPAHPPPLPPLSPILLWVGFTLLAGSFSSSPSVDLSLQGDTWGQAVGGNAYITKTPPARPSCDQGPLILTNTVCLPCRKSVPPSLGVRFIWSHYSPNLFLMHHNCSDITSHYFKVKWTESLSRVWLFATPWTMESMELSRPEY